MLVIDPETRGERREASADPAVVVCAHCAQRTTERRNACRWCPLCGVYLVPCAITGQWVSFAERTHREDERRWQQLIACSRQRTTAAAPTVRALAPAGWLVAAQQLMPGACYTVQIGVPGTRAVADLVPEERGGWSVRLFDGRTGWPLYVSGGARVAVFAEVRQATEAALNDLAVCGI